MRTQVMGTAQYSPPEALAASRISRATDIYSLAMLSESTWREALAKHAAGVL